MGKFIQDGTGVVISVADEKDERFAVGYQPFTDEPDTKRGPGRPKKTDADKSSE